MEGADMLRRFIRVSNNLKLKHKLLISYVLVVMIPVLIIGLAVTGYFRQQALDNAIGQTINNVDKIKSQTATLLRVPTDISDILMFNNELKEIVNKRYSSVMELIWPIRIFRNTSDNTVRWQAFVFIPITPP